MVGSFTWVTFQYYSFSVAWAVRQFSPSWRSVQQFLRAVFNQIFLAQGWDRSSGEAWMWRKGGGAEKFQQRDDIYKYMDRYKHICHCIYIFIFAYAVKFIYTHTSLSLSIRIYIAEPSWNQWNIHQVPIFWDAQCTNQHDPRELENVAETWKCGTDSQISRFLEYRYRWMDLEAKLAWTRGHKECQRARVGG